MIRARQRLAEIAVGCDEVPELQLTQAELGRGPRRSRYLIGLREHRQRFAGLVVGAQLHPLADQRLRLLRLRRRARVRRQRRNRRQRRERRQLRQRRQLSQLSQLRLLPSVDELLQSTPGQQLIQRFSRRFNFGEGAGIEELI